MLQVLSVLDPNVSGYGPFGFKSGVIHLLTEIRITTEYCHIPTQIYMPSSAPV